jgi:hypothetical protein
MSVFRISDDNVESSNMEAIIHKMFNAIMNQEEGKDEVLDEFIKLIKESDPVDYHSVFEHAGLSAQDIYYRAVDTKYEEILVPFVFKMRIRAVASGLTTW